MWRHTTSGRGAPAEGRRPPALRSVLQPTPAWIVSAVVVVVPTLVLRVRMLADGVGGGAIPAAFLAAVILVVGAWCAPLAKAPGAFGGSMLAPWRPEFEGPKVTQVAAGGLVALLIGLISSSGAVAGCILGIAVAVGLGFVLKVPDARVVEEVAGSRP